jgi:DNA-binding GntR family transcriptional regulator
MAKGFERIWQTIAQDLKEAIIKGELSPGQRLRISDLIERYDVSNTPIREAIHYLESQGFVQSIPRRMVLIREITLKDVEDIYAIQSALEGLAAGLAACNSGKDDVEQLCDLFEKLEKAVESGNVSRYAKIHQDFHEQITASSGNKRILPIIRNARDQVQRFRYIMFNYTPRMRETLKEHRRILDAIMNRDAPAAENAMKEHICVAAELLKNIIQKEEGHGILSQKSQTTAQGGPKSGSRHSSGNSGKSTK